MQRQGTDHERDPYLFPESGESPENIPETLRQGSGTSAPTDGFRKHKKTAAGRGRLDGVHEQICVKETCDADPGTDRRNLHGLFHLKPFTRRYGSDDRR